MDDLKLSTNPEQDIRDKNLAKKKESAKHVDGEKKTSTQTPGTDQEAVDVSTQKVDTNCKYKT